MEGHFQSTHIEVFNVLCQKKIRTLVLLSYAKFSHKPYV